MAHMEKDCAKDINYIGVKSVKTQVCVDTSKRGGTNDISILKKSYTRMC